MLVQLGFLKSYENMGIGVARWVQACTAAPLPLPPTTALTPYSVCSLLSITSCTSGCKCGDKDIDAHHTDHVSQTYLSSLRVSQHPNCTVTITISNRTSSGGHKFKMNAIMVSDVAGEEPGK